jgi:alpha-galactosidase
VGGTSAAEEARAVHHVAGIELEVVGDPGSFAVRVAGRKVADGLDVVTLGLESPVPAPPPKLTLKWPVPSHDVAGHWATGRFLNKTVRPDWSGSRLQPSMFAREAPVHCLYGSDDRNVLTFAVSDALDTISSGSGVREEDGLVYNEVVLFEERHPSLREHRIELRIDRRPVPYWTALGEVAEWWAAQPGYAPAPVPESARRPIYSTWYNFHQKVDAAVLLKEVALAKQVGFESIIVDDGWQTLDSSRGYAYTGDWEPERLREMKAFVDGCHKEGMKVLLWYAVPFAGTNARAGERFKDKALRFEERLGAYVLDPRYPEVRQYLVDVYRKALQDWGIDGLKLDFIERFVADEKTVLEAAGGRDYAPVNEAADRLLTDVLAELRTLNPEVLIEFRQPYIGPLIRKYGNMLRASDCPNSYLSNRVKTVDLRLLSGTTAVHGDMILWHYGEAVEIAALQFASVLFSVPQVSVRLGEIPPDHLAMVKFYTTYWNANRSVLLDGKFEPRSPSANYPLIRARGPGKEIVGVYADVVVELGGATRTIDVVNGKHSEAVVLSSERDLGSYRYSVRDCQGRSVATGRLRLNRGATRVSVPVSGVLALERVR